MKKPKMPKAICVPHFSLKEPSKTLVEKIFFNTASYQKPYKDDVAFSLSDIAKELPLGVSLEDVKIEIVTDYGLCPSVRCTAAIPSRKLLVSYSKEIPNPNFYDEIAEYIAAEAIHKMHLSKCKIKKEKYKIKKKKYDADMLLYRKELLKSELESINKKLEKK